ncbi:gamma-crystallin S-1-like [Mobula hypostoma]|uniref:gamma-crystallin S-1-like n=1 Tax=Mobula hypostoma TaxID=723540 RepID=UPI002FC3891F
MAGSLVTTEADPGSADSGTVGTREQLECGRLDAAAGSSIYISGGTQGTAGSGESIVNVPYYRSVAGDDAAQELLTQICSFPQIIFYEDRNFQGRHYECSSDSADLSPYFSRCNSIRVESDWWVLYERPNYMGYQYILSRGEYPDYKHWMGFNDCVRSCRSYPYYRGGNYRMRIYERPDFAGQMMEFMDNCLSVYDRFRYRDIHSCQVMDGYWIFYEHPNYRGRQYFLRPGEYRRYSDWGGYNSMIGSFRRMRDF